jgi:outer membrane protein TolC
MERKLFIGCIAAFLLIKGNAQTLGLDSILRVIQENHPAMKMYDADIRSMDEASNGAKSWMPPQLESGFWMTPYDVSLWKEPGSHGGTGMGQYMISAQQMFPNKKEQQANEKFMQAMSSASKETKQVSLNVLYAKAKESYYMWLITEKKLKVLQKNERILDFMIQSAELRYKNNLGKLVAYYKAKAALGNIANQRIMMQNEIKQQRIMLNTLMNRDKNIEFSIDSIYTSKNYSEADSSYFVQSRSDIKAIDRSIEITKLQQDLERAKLKPQFGVRYDHMFGFGGLPMQFSLMAMVKLPIVSWSSRMNKATIESLNWKSLSLIEQKQMILNEATGEHQSMLAAIESKKKQVELYEINIIPALQRNYQTMQLSYEQNTGELFELFDAWETLTMAEMEQLSQLQDLLLMQVEMDKILQQK